MEISAKHGKGIDRLLEVIAARKRRFLTSRPTGRRHDANGVVVESELDKGRGPVATVLVEKGMLRSGDSVRDRNRTTAVCGTCSTSAAPSVGVRPVRRSPCSSLGHRRHSPGRRFIQGRWLTRKRPGKSPPAGGSRQKERELQKNLHGVA
ncbi:MAG: hypothetical protein MZV70_77310 [Desulfobacterales bacterium]|nr:hypothetical protein [Desulfobacterales bacterium]